jgi:hypothetical protein
MSTRADDGARARAVSRRHEIKITRLKNIIDVAARNGESAARLLAELLLEEELGT